MPGESLPNTPPTKIEQACNDERGAGQSLFEWLSKHVGVPLGLVYIVGFLVVTSHLSRYGVSSLSLFHLQYLVAGAWVIAPIVVLRCMQLAAQLFTNRALSERRDDGRVTWRRRLIVAGIVAIPEGLVMGAMATLLIGMHGATWRLGAALWVFYLLLVYCFDLIWICWKVPAQIERAWWLSRRALPFYTTMLVSLFLVYVFFFASRIYQLIPSSVGGGEPMTVVFLIGEKETPDFLKRDGASSRSVPYKLLTATEKTYVILPSLPGEKSIEFSRDVVLGVVVLEEPAPK
jgi:hypothetical protein